MGGRGNPPASPSGSDSSRYDDFSKAAGSDASDYDDFSKTAAVGK